MRKKNVSPFLHLVAGHGARYEAHNRKSVNYIYCWLAVLAHSILRLYDTFHLLRECRNTLFEKIKDLRRRSVVIAHVAISETHLRERSETFCTRDLSLRCGGNFQSAL
jgi:hypothetical protein